MLKQAGAEPGEPLVVLSPPISRTTPAGREAVAGSDYVLHVASPFPQNVPKHEDELIVPAREGALRVLRAARDAGVKRVVLDFFLCRDRLRPTRSRRGLSTKRPGPTWSRRRCASLCEVENLGRARRLGFHRARRRRPGAFRGQSGGRARPGARGRIIRPSILLVRRLMDGAVPGCPRLYFGVVDVRDIADLHIRAMTNAAAKGERFIGVAGDFLSVREIAEALKDASGGRGATRADPATARLAGAHVCADRSGGAADRAGARQDQERHQRKGEAFARLGAALDAKMPSSPPAESLVRLRFVQGQCAKKAA